MAMRTSMIGLMMGVWGRKEETIGEKERHNLVRRKERWKKPGAGVLKINSEGAYTASTGKGGWGFVIRDDQGDVVKAGAGHCQHLLDAFHAEMIACLMGIRAAIALGISNEIVETDSSVALETTRFALVAIGAQIKPNTSRGPNTEARTEEKGSSKPSSTAAAGRQPRRSAINSADFASSSGVLSNPYCRRRWTPSRSAVTPPAAAAGEFGAGEFDACARCAYSCSRAGLDSDGGDSSGPAKCYYQIKTQLFNNKSGQGADSDSLIPVLGLGGRRGFT
ncbi:hypothetical protein C2845_PM16G01240 [Panicum miliaceum]|uniref:RNase H type-1 domain-containing protein n=1 Tax=Panicum miliaceum TaxID=4540 RepID=A0A3L6PUX2_PANMI|nr:hypothetical protein C2845_PM16G01240 [Panicum miliaceum]